MLEVLEPCTGVKLGVDGVDDPWVLVACRCLLDLEKDETNDWPWAGDWCSVGGFPADGDRLAVILEVELLEVDLGLLALTSLELLAVTEGRAEQRKSLSSSTLWAGVDEGVDGLAVVGEVDGECLVRECIAVVPDELGVVVGDLLRVGLRQALSVVPALAWGSESSDGGEKEKRGSLE